MSALPALEDVQKLYGAVQVIYGPYVNNYDRRFVLLYYGNRKQKCISYPKLLLELYIGRVLISDETCDHIDNNKLNDDISNLQVLSRADNASKSGIRETFIVLECCTCGKVFKRSTRIHRRNLRINRTAWFCRKICAGEYQK